MREEESKPVKDIRQGWMDSRNTGYLASISTPKRGKEPEFLDGKNKARWIE